MSSISNKEPTAPSKIGRPVNTNAGLVEIQIEYRSVGDLVLDARNPRQHSQRQINQIADSIREFGFIMPVVADDDHQVVIGHFALPSIRFPIDRPFDTVLARFLFFDHP